MSDKEEKDFAGILQLTSLEHPALPAESSTDEEDMDFEKISDNNDQKSASENIIFNVDKSTEELHVETLSGNSSIDNSLNIDSDQAVCDTNSSSSFCLEKDDTKKEITSLEKKDSIGSDIDQGSSTKETIFNTCAAAGDSCEGVTKFNVLSSEGYNPDNITVNKNLEHNSSEMPSDNSSDETSGKVHVHVDNNFNTFQYWRSPLPEVNIDFDIINGQPTNIHVVAKVKDEEANKVYASAMNVNILSDSSSSAQKDTILESNSTSSNMIQSDSEKSGVRIHTASVSTVSEGPNETVSNIGSTHVLGQNLGQQHLAIVDGVVQGRYIKDTKNIYILSKI